MAIGAVAEAMGLVTITLPPWLLAVSYAFLGWSVGLGFTREILIHASRALPQILLAIFAIIGICGVFAFVLVQAAGIDPMTAYLATCPGGVDSIAIIGASSNADLSFVMTMQTLRLLIVLLAGPSIARLIAQRMSGEEIDANILQTQRAVRMLATVRLPSNPLSRSSTVQTTDRLFAGSIPDIYDRFLVPLIFEAYATDLAERIARANPKDVLETAAGTGVLTRAMASKLPAHARIVATDLNQPMLDHAAADSMMTAASHGGRPTPWPCRFRTKPSISWRASSA